MLECRAVQHVTVERDFALPPARVFAFLSEHENLGPLFGSKVTRLRDGTDGTRNGVGSERRLKVGPLPPFVETVVEVVPERLIRYRITKGSPLRDHEGVMEFSPAGEGTHLRYVISFNAVVPGLDRLVAANLRRSIARGLERVDERA